MTVQTFLPGAIKPTGKQARIVCAGIGTVVLPWWPDSLDYSGLAPRYTDVDRPAAESLIHRSFEPLETLTIVFMVSGSNRNESVEYWSQMVRQLARAKPLCQLVLGDHDRGRWLVADAGYTESDQTATGEPSVMEVTLQLRQKSQAVITVGPVRAKARKRAN